MVPLKWALIFFTHGRKRYAERTLASAADNLPEPTASFAFDDSKDDSYTHWLAQQRSWTEVYGNPVAMKRPRFGFSGNVARAWQRLDGEDFDFVFHLEDDFEFTEPVDLEGMTHVLFEHGLAQIALQRQPWNPIEQAAGGVAASRRDCYEEHSCDHRDRPTVWSSHRLFFTTNPSVYPIGLCGMGWPREEESEGRFSAKLFETGARVAYWGRVDDEPRVIHIGQERGRGTGY